MFQQRLAIIRVTLVSPVFFRHLKLRKLLRGNCDRDASGRDGGKGRPKRTYW